MEAIIGFAIGYWAGTRDGREGLQKALQAFDAITKSEEFKSLMTQGLSVGGAMLSKGLNKTGGFSMAQGVVGVGNQGRGPVLHRYHAVPSVPHKRMPQVVGGQIAVAVIG